MAISKQLGSAQTAAEYELKKPNGALIFKIMPNGDIFVGEVNLTEHLGAGEEEEGGGGAPTLSNAVEYINDTGSTKNLTSADSGGVFIGYNAIVNVPAPVQGVRFTLSGIEAPAGNSLNVKFPTGTVIYSASIGNVTTGADSVLKVYNGSLKLISPGGFWTIVEQTAQIQYVA